MKESYNKIVVTDNPEEALPEETNELPESIRIRAGIALLLEAVKLTGLDVKGFDIYQNGDERIVEVKFVWGSEYANITIDNARAAIWDVLRQIPELRT